MLRRIMMAATSSGGVDPHRANVVSHLRFNGDFVDTTGRVWSAVGSPGFSSAGKFGQGGDFNGTSQYIHTPDAADLDLGSGAFTVELWVYVKSNVAYAIFTAKGNSAVNQLPFLLSLDGSGTRVQFGTADSGSGSPWIILVSSVTLPLNQWVHVAGVRDGSALRLYQDGVQRATGTISGGVRYNNLPLSIAANHPGNAYAPIRVDEFRITKGVARYAGNFTPPISPFPTS